MCLRCIIACENGGGEVLKGSVHFKGFQQHVPHVYSFLKLAKGENIY